MTDYSPEDLTQKTHSHLNTYITSADQKASILLTAQFAFVGFYSSGVSNVWTNSSSCFKLFSGLTISAGLIGAILAGAVVYPRSPKGDENGLMFWESISNQSQSEFVSNVTSLSNADALEEVVSQNHTLAGVAETKYKFARFALIATAVTVGFAALSAGSYFLVGS